MTPTAQTIYGVVVLLTSFIIGFLAYMWSRKVDAATAQSGFITKTRTNTAQIIEGLNQLINNLRIDNGLFLEDIRLLTTRIGARDKEIDELRQRINWLNRRYEDNSDSPDENSASK